MIRVGLSPETLCQAGAAWIGRADS